MVTFCVLFCFPFIFSGEVFAWGDNDEGQLGDGTTNAIQRPRVVSALQGKETLILTTFNY